MRRTPTARRAGRHRAGRRPGRLQPGDAGARPGQEPARRVPGGVAGAPRACRPTTTCGRPTPGAPRPQEGTARTRRSTAVFGPSGTQVATGNAPGDPGGVAPIRRRRAGAAAERRRRRRRSQHPPGGQPGDHRSRSRRTAELHRQADLLAQDAGAPGTVIDPPAEQQRLQENAALGKPVTEGETPIIMSARRRPCWKACSDRPLSSIGGEPAAAPCWRRLAVLRR